MEKSPCKDCDERYLGCHSKCSKYKEFRAAKDKEIEENLKRARFHSAFYKHERRKGWQ